MIASSLREGLDLPPALGAVAKQRQQRIRQLLRRAILLDEFRHDILAEHQIGQDHRRHRDQTPRDRRPPNRDTL